MRALAALLVLLLATCVCAHKIVPVSGLSIAGRHARAWYETIQQLREQGYSYFALPEPTKLPYYIKGEVVASKEPIVSVEWSGYKVAKVVKPN